MGLDLDASCIEKSSVEGSAEREIERWHDLGHEEAEDDEQGRRESYRLAFLGLCQRSDGGEDGEEACSLAVMDQKVERYECLVCYQNRCVEECEPFPAAIQA